MSRPHGATHTKTAAMTPVPLEMSLVLLDISSAVKHKHGKGQTLSFRLFFFVCVVSFLKVEMHCSHFILR